MCFWLLSQSLLVGLTTPLVRSHTMRRSLHHDAFGIWSSIGLWGNAQATAALVYHALLATPGAAGDAGVGHGSSGHPDDIDEQRTSSPINWRSAFENARVVGKII